MNRRPGMTLLELLVVMAIIALLAALLLVAVHNVIVKGQELECYNDLVGMHIAIADFISGKGGLHPMRPGFLPSVFDPSGGDPGSAAFINRMFPSAGGTLKLPAAKLQGDEILVLLLAGPNGNGWSTNPKDPTAPGGERMRFYTFKQERLVDPDGNGYPSYQDRYRTPIAYFSPWHWNGTAWSHTGYTADCPRLGLDPYANVDSATWQLVSAGNNRRFGQDGAIWTAATAAAVYQARSDGADDQANFSRVRLGVTGR